jgi:signal recognition particle GTPase
MKAELRLSGLGYGELVEHLAKLGVQDTYKGVANKITRGRFTFAFFLQCMKALDKDGIKFD